MRSNFAAVAILFVSATALAWDPRPVAGDRNVFLPGSQPGSVALESATRCDNCHGGYNKAVEPAHNWRGSMMAQAARDPLWLAAVTVANQDSIWALGNPNAGDLCIRCHSPIGWLGGRSDPTNMTRLAGSDYEGVSCDACHRMVDPISALRQSPELATETVSAGITEANKTYSADFNVLSPLTLFDGTSFFNSTSRLPRYFGNGALPNYIEGTGGQYFVDPTSPKRGPRYDAEPKHQWYYSRYHKSKTMCGTCHDVSNPVLARLALGAAVPEQQAAASYSHVERTFSEFMASAYGKNGGASTAAKIGVGTATKCQDCHMRNVTGIAANKAGLTTRSDLALHDMTGGNAWISGILASADSTGPSYDSYNYAILSGAKYPGATIDVRGLQGSGQALLDGRSRALQQLQMAADLVLVSETTSGFALRIVNNSGHKLISGFPEGRRMWLNVKFFDAAGAMIGEINPYAPLATTRDASGNEQYASGGDLQVTRDDLVYEAKLSSSVTGEADSFHFVLGDDRHKDNRIPPKGFDTTIATARLALPRWEGATAPSYFTASEYLGGYDEVTIAKPAATARWSASLYYQTTSKAYIDFLRNELDGTVKTLPASAYIAQSDPFFATMKDTGRAMWDLWLHNGGAAPVLMVSRGDAPSCAAPSAPAGLTATGGKRLIKLAWGAVSSAAGYRVYYSQGGKTTLRTTTTSTTFTDSGLTPDQTYCYVVTAFVNCADGTTRESGVSNIACGVALRK